MSEHLLLRLAKQNSSREMYSPIRHIKKIKNTSAFLTPDGDLVSKALVFFIFFMCRRIGEYMFPELSHFFVCCTFSRTCHARPCARYTSVENSSPPLLANGRRVSVRLDSRKRPIPVSRRTAFAIIVNSHFPFACRKFNQFRVG